MNIYYKCRLATVAGIEPTPEELGEGEISLNLADGKIFSKGPDGVVVQMAAAASWNDLLNKPSTFPPNPHDHDAQYAQLVHNHDATYAPIAHTHSSYALINHTHSQSDVVDLETDQDAQNIRILALETEQAAQQIRIVALETAIANGGGGGGDVNVDGGSAASSVDEIIDGGAAATTYAPQDNIDGGTA
jgi:hypothetical protein